MRKVRIALAQMKMADSFSKNVENSLVLMKEAHRRDANMICFPELQFQRFFPQYSGRKEPFERAMSANCSITNRFRIQAGRFDMVTVLNFFEKSAGRYYDSSPVIDADGKLLGVSRMVHIVQIKHFYEQDYYSPSNTGFKVYDTKFGKVGVVICFDRHFPESFRLMALQGAEIVFVPSANLKGEPLDLFEAELRAAAYQNNLFIAMTNRAGREGDVTFCGESMLVDPAGRVLRKAGGGQELITARIDLDLVKNAGRERPFLTLRRPGHYGKITRGK